MDQIVALLEDNPEDKILGMLCNWCSYAGADLAGISRYDYPTNIRGVRMMCSGRYSEQFVLEAFRRGAGMVLMSGCRLTETGSDCHYISGNVWAEKRFNRIAARLKKMGLDERRFRLEWVSAAEGDKWAHVITEMTAHLKDIGRDAIIAENERIRPELEKRLERLLNPPKPKAKPKP
jgi:heterodisulfide reductase subunit A